MISEKKGVVYRTFFAAVPSREVRSELGELCNKAEFMSVSRELRWVPEQNIHLTLRFLGPTPADVIPTLIEEAERIGDDFSASTLHLDRVAAFPPRKPGVLAATGTADENLHQIVAAINNCVAELGRSAERRDYRPHITLARFRKRPYRRRAPEPVEIDLTVEIDEIVLYRSHLSSKAARYEVLHRIELNG